MNFTIASHAVSIGWIIALLVLISCLVIYLAGAVTTPLILALIAGLALAYVIG